MKLPFALLAPVTMAFLGACAPTIQEQPLVNPVFAPGQVYELTWEDGTKPSTVTIPAMYSNKEGQIYYTGDTTKSIDNASASYVSN